jgi:hypothetical protein
VLVAALESEIMKGSIRRNQRGCNYSKRSIGKPLRREGLDFVPLLRTAKMISKSHEPTNVKQHLR